MSQYSTFRCALSDLQNNEKRLISNDLRFCVVNPLKVAFAVLFHVARHTFATTVTLANDVALQNVSKMLGHSSTRMTKHYARVLDNSIMKDMQDVARVFG